MIGCPEVSSPFWRKKENLVAAILITSSWEEKFLTKPGSKAVSEAPLWGYSYLLTGSEYSWVWTWDYIVTL